jgi:type I restriction enzyme M protein
MRQNQVEQFIQAMGFINKEGNVWSKSYHFENVYSIEIDFDNQYIDYGIEIERGDDTTSNFRAQENLVVLECVNRLLQKGYHPKNITLEKRWRKDKKTAGIGKADITITGLDGKTIIIIECKQFGKEYRTYKSRIKHNGGQLFQYFQQDKNTRYLCLYASQLNKGRIEYENVIVKVEDSAAEKAKQEEQPDKCITFFNARNVDEMLAVWEKKSKKAFIPSGIFEDDVEPYNPVFVPLRVKNLVDFEKDDAKRIFGEFEEVLRHNNISDRSNAFNRFISLMLAKIVDESKTDDKVTDFQIKEGIDTPEDLQERLQILYTKAMKDYLGETVINYTQDDIEAIISHFPKQTAKDELKRIYKELKYYTNNEFGFKEIYNEQLFKDNAKVLIEIILLFQKFRFKYNRKAQFLGDFFEQMLESGYKQSEGQFFTPTPIAKFIVSSLPIKQIILRKIENKDIKILPLVVDYACGSGHFITESIEEIQEVIKTLKDSLHKDLPDFKKSTKWAGDYIIGIEKDYRLARTSQVACFLHGDGDAKIIFGDGLEEHEKMPIKSYDILVANPPYTIKDFKKHLNFERLAKFELLNDLSIDSDDIEVLFVERTKQLVTQNGYAGIFLPASILSNPGIYEKAREILLKYFEIKSIVEMGKYTFSATGTTTVILFMQRRSDEFWKDCQYIANDLILGLDHKRTNDFVNSQELLSIYISQIGVDEKGYKKFLLRESTPDFIETDFYKDYKVYFDNLIEIKNLKKNPVFLSLEPNEQNNKLLKRFYEVILDIEKDKFLYFLFCHRQVRTKEIGSSKTNIKFVPQETLIVKCSKDSDDQKKFLGYTFSDRRGYKGLDLKLDEYGHPLTKLYDPDIKSNPQKVNFYIAKALLNEQISEIGSDVQSYITQTSLVDCFNFERVVFEKQINVTKIENPFLSSTFPLLRFNKIATLEYGAPLPEVKRIPGVYPVMGSNGRVGSHNSFLVEGPAIIVGRKGSAGKVTLVEENCFPIDTTFYVQYNKTEVRLKYIFYLLKALRIEEMAKSLGVPGLNRNEVHNLKIPVPGKDIQDNIITALEAIETKSSQSTSNKKSFMENESLIAQLQYDQLLQLLECTIEK